MDIWVTARLEGDEVSASVRTRTEYDDGKYVTSEIAVTDEATLGHLATVLGEVAAAVETQVRLAARLDAARMLVASSRGATVGGGLGVAGDAAPQKVRG